MVEDKYYFEREVYSNGDGFDILDKEILDSICRYKKKGFVLDLGFGSGMLSIELAKRGFSVTAVDISKKAVLNLEKEASENGLEIKIIQADIEEYKITQEYDVIVFCGVSHFLKNPRKLIEEIKLFTKYNGLNVVDVLTGEVFKEGEINKIYGCWEIKEFDFYNQDFGNMNYLVAIKN